MRIARNQRLINSSESGSSDAETAVMKEMSAHPGTAAADLLWTTRDRPQGIARVPTHAVLPVEERRAYARAKISLPLRVRRIAGQKESNHRNLRTANISSSGVLFLCLQRIEPGTPVEIEVSLIDRPFGRGSVRMMTEAHVVRAEPAAISGWHAVALSFDDITFQRDEPLPSNFERR